MACEDAWVSRRDVVVLGSTGSIGTQALDLVRANPDRFRVVGLSAGGSQEELFEQQVAEFAPAYVGLGESASLMGAHAIGRSIDELEAARDALTAFLAGGRDDPGDWPGLEIFGPARAYPARHPSIRLAFEAVAEAAALAAAKRRDAAA